VRSTFLHIILVCLLTGLANAQPGQIHFTRVDISRGLSQNQVKSIYRDKIGYVWIGTSSGLNRYDGYSFKIFRNAASDPNSISDNIIETIHPFPNERLLVITRGGANIYDPAKEQFSQNLPALLKGFGIQTAANISKCLKDERSQYWFLFADGSLYLYKPQENKIPRVASSLPVSDCFADGKGGLWVIYTNGRIQQWNTATLQPGFASNQLCFTAGNQPSSYYLFVDSRADCWVYKTGEALGLYKLSHGDGKVEHFSKESDGHKLRANLIAGITEDLQGNIWIATDHGGINLLNAKTGAMQYLENNVDDQRSISQNSITAMYRDTQGIIWVGTYKQGFNYFNQTVARFPLYKHLSNKPGLPYDDVNRFVEDAKGNLWIGTNGGGLIYFDRAANRFQQYLAGPNSISNNVIVSLCIDHQQKLWIGSYYGGLDCFDGKRFTHYKNDPADEGSLSDNRVWEIFEDSRQNLWIGTLNGGLNKLDRKTNRFIHYKADTSNPLALQSNYVSAIIETKDQRLWIGSSDGIDIFDPATQRFRHIGKTAGAGSLSNDVVLCLMQDSRGLVWVGTREGLNLYNKATGKFRTFGRQDGLTDNTILNILEDNHGQLWISTAGGISQMEIPAGHFEPEQLKASFHNYDELNNLQAREFNENAALKTSKGELIFGGPYGFNIFQPGQIAGNHQKPSVVLTGFDLFNKELPVGEKIDGKVLLSQSISQTKELVLPYNQDVFSITFAALDFSHTEKDRYAYAMEGFNDNWLLTDGNQRRATFTNLDPGKYVFKVRSVNNSGELSDNETRLAITILPPFWKTPLAFLLYAIAIIAALWLARRIILQRAHMRFAMAQVRKEAQRMHELDLMKIRFITNVSHEFRTPLSLILSPADKLLKQAHEPEQKKQFLLIHRNARRLLNLVNQLLDFRKLEVAEFSFLPAEADIVAFVKEISYSFTDIAEKKNIGFSFSSAIERRTMFFDADKMEKILFNLLSNAYKFTPEGGEVRVEISEEQSQLGSLEQKALLQIKVCDSGIGIPADKQQKIFERFFQHEMPGNILNQGSGIGLAIVHEFVKLHDGSIQVDSEPGKGSCFTVLLPVKETAGIVMPTTEATGKLLADTEETAAHSETHLPKLKGKRNTVLLVEDNEDFRFYLKDNLGLHFHIVEAGNGKDGWQKALEHQPDLVVSDVMMPIMDGLELAQKLKHDPRTASIPIILLTARSAEEQQLEGLDTGANDYVTKPFSFEILLSKIKNLLQQQKLNKKPARQITVSTADVQIDNLDEKAIQLALQIVEKNMSNPDFSVEDMSREMMMSRVGLYKKMLTLTGKTPIEFIRDIRLARSLQLLEKSELTVAEIAYEVGYNDPKYFAKTFKKAFGVLPSGYLSRAKSEEKDL
jgi:signal transduction histidine kinase/ligand-binding sensor domain-containing protein/AraC-like DNA-binding protein